MSTELPKQEQLIKLLAMTTSTNDAEALAFMRKANALLAAAGWDWEKLIRGKIRVLEDPFKSIAEPPPAPPPARTPPPRQPQPQTRPQPRPWTAHPMPRPKSRPKTAPSILDL